MWSSRTPTGFRWKGLQSLWVAAFAAAASLLPIRPRNEIPPRDSSADPRPPGSWILYEDTLEVNAAAPEDLERLPGIGPALAAQIVARRTELRGFCEAAELAAVARLGRSRWARMVPLVSVRPAPRCSSSGRG